MPSPRVSRLFNEALELPEEERERFLRDAEPDEKTRRQVKALLHAHAETGDFLGTGAAAKLLLVPNPPRLKVGETIGSFTIQGEIGAGSFGTVYRAFDTALSREVALKVTRDVGDEGRTMARLEHDNIVRVFSETRLPDRDLRLLCLPYLAGSSLQRVLDRTEGRALDGRRYLEAIHATAAGAAAPDPAAERERDEIRRFSPTDLALWLGIKLADALTYAHGKGVLHLDIKPENILLTPYGRPLLGDFNVSQRLLGEVSRNVRGGTPRYMAPEQEALFRGGEATLDERTDLFAVGVLLGRLLERAPPNDAVAAVLAKCTAPDPAKRYAGAAQLASALRGLRETLSMEAPAGPVVRLQGRAPFACLASAGLIPVAANVLLTAVFLTRLDPPRELLPRFDVLREMWRTFAVPAAAWAVLILAARGMGARGRRLSLFLPLFLLGTGVAAAWSIPVQLLARAAAGLALPRQTDFTYARLGVPFMVLAVNAAFLWAQFLCARVLFPSGWAGESEALARGRRLFSRAMKVSLAVQIALALVPLSLGLAGFAPKLTGLALPLPLTVLALLAAGAGVAGTFFSLLLWTRLSRSFKG